MKYFKDPVNNEVFAYEADGSQDEFIRLGLQPISDEDLAALRAEQEAASAPGKEQLAQIAQSKRNDLLASAGLNIAPLQDSVDLGKASAADISKLKLWKQYRIDVSKVEEQSGFPERIDWPVAPA